MKQKQRKQKQQREAESTLLSGKELVVLSKKESGLSRCQYNFSIGGQEISVVDISLRGDEDAVYPENKSYYENIRRGLSVIVFYKNQSESSYGICRRGLKKFFDIYLEFIKPDVKATWVSNNKNQAKIRSLVFDEPLSLLRNEEPVTIHVTEKANGENASISYQKDIDQWIVCSKNCSMLMGDPGCASDSRFTLTNRIAEVWLTVIQPLDVKLIKERLTGTTLVGEFVGHPNHRHIIDYPQPMLRFYALVDHDSKDTCVNPTETFKWLESVRLPCVACTSFPPITNEAAFFAKLNEIYADVAKNSMAAQGEGVVVYFEGLVDEQPTCLSLGKMKTLEYRLIRKLREKVRYCMASSADTLKFYKQYCEEAAVLCQFNSPKDKPLSYFQELASKCFKEIDKANAELSPSELKSFRRSVNVHFMEFVRQAAQGLVISLEAVDEEQIEEEKEQPNPVCKNTSITILMPMTIPSCGKSQFAKALHDYAEKASIDTQILSISSDRVREGLMKEYMAKNKNVTKQEAFDRTDKPSRTAYDNALHQVLDQAMASTHAKVLIMLDKNHPVNAIEKVLKVIRTKVPTAKVIGLVPKCGTPYRDYPFSLEFLCSCLRRAIERVQHETLTGTPEHIASIVILFFKFFRGVKFNEIQLEGILEFPFTIEECGVPELLGQIKGVLQPIMKLKDPKQMEKDPLMAELLSLVKSYDWGFPTWENQCRALTDRQLV